MSTRALFNLTLALLAAGLIMIVYYKPGLEPDSTPQPITMLDPEQVSDIRITRALREPLHIVKQNGAWLLAGTPELPASGFQVRALLPLLQATAARSYPASSLDPAALGLDPPQATVTLDAMEIRIGTTEALENKRYAQVGDTVYLIDDRYQHLINADWSNFVSRKLLPADAAITQLQLPAMSLTRTADGQWRVTPERPDTSADAIRQLIDTWQRSSALYVRRYASTLADESISVTTGAGNATITFKISSHTPDFILARPDLGIQYHLSSDQEASLLSLREAKPAQKPDTSLSE